MPQQFVNNYSTTVASQLLTVGSTLTVASGDGAALQAKCSETISASNFVLLTLVRKSGGVETAWEIVKVTAQSGDNLTLDLTGGRAKEGSSNLQWEIGEDVEARWTAGSATSIQGTTGTFTEEYVSADLAVTAGSNHSLTHGLSTTPKIVQVYLRNITPEHGFSAGDITLLDTSKTGSNEGTQIVVGASTIQFQVSLDVTPIGVLDKSSRAYREITTANWRAFVRAYA